MLIQQTRFVVCFVRSIHAFTLRPRFAFCLPWPGRRPDNPGSDAGP